MTASDVQRAEETVADPRWRAIASRDAGADGAFVYGVITTSIYCRPTCSSRLAKPENVRFFGTAYAAEKAGFRPCKRCRPDEETKAAKNANLVAELCRFIESTDPMPTLKALAQQAGWSTYHLHRIFKTVTGLTPKAYGRAYRAKRVREALREDTAVTAAIYQAGYVSSGRFYAESDHILGMTPHHYKHGGTDVEIRFAVAECSLGTLLIAQSQRGICCISLGDDAEVLVRALQDQFPAAILVGCDASFEKQVAQVIGFIEAPQLGLDLPLDIRGTAFQQRVWAALVKIPPGQTLSYRELAERIGAPKAARAVAKACAANTLAVAIPCHRIVRHDGNVSGYRWGVERKRALLEREKET